MLFEKAKALPLQTKKKQQGRSVNGTWYYWGMPMSRYNISLRRGRRGLHLFEFFGALVFTLGFFALFVWSVIDQDLIDALFTTRFWTNPRSSVTALFWLALIFMCFVIYRSATMWKKGNMIDHEPYLAPATKKQPKKSWRAKNIDIAKTYAEEARRVIEQAYHLAETNKHKQVTPAHFFVALLSVPSIRGIFVRLNVSAPILQKQILQLLPKQQAKKSPTISKDVWQILFQSFDIAVKEKQSQVYIADVLLATVKQSEPLQEMLYEMKIDNKKLANVIEWIRIKETLRKEYKRFRRAAARRSKHGIDRAMTAVATPFLNNYSQDITLAAKFGHIEQCVARDNEIEEIFRIIEGGRQSVILVGEHGAGKMSIVEGITERMIEDRVPDRLKDKRLVQLSTSALLAGATTNGAIERLRQMMAEIARAGNVILFINNLHDLISAPGDSEGLDVSEALSEFLGSSKFLTIATTTPKGYNKHITNSQVGSVFTRVDTSVMTPDQAIQVLESKVGRIEYDQKVFFSYDALHAAVTLSERFLHDQILPESAINIVVEAASYTHNQKGENAMVRADDVAAVISQKTGIPTTSISEDESSKLMRLEEAMHERVVGQDEAVVLVANALRRARAQIRSTKRPIANFLFLGPTGVGKTELAKTIADVYFGGEERMIRIDMSEFQDKSGIYRLIGEPNKQGTGLLTEAVRQQPFSLVLLDEMEKADPDVLTLFLQVFDDGRLTDSVGRVIDFTNTIIIATSNAGTQYVADELKKGVSTTAIRDALIRGELKKYYRPEFLNRFDGIVLFRALERGEIKKIAGLMLKRVAKDLEERGVALEVTDEALESLGMVGFDPEFGARPMRRAIQEHVENKLAEMILSGKLKRRDTVVIGNNIHIDVKKR